jgi:hypothetical protein
MLFILKVTDKRKCFSKFGKKLTKHPPISNIFLKIIHSKSDLIYNFGFTSRETNRLKD